ncbi:MAG: hypothetical protein ACRDY0_08870 [Acidimicrobiales bacterium]
MVTHEVVAHSTKKIKTPNACLGVGVRYVTLFEISVPNGPASSAPAEPALLHPVAAASSRSPANCLTPAEPCRGRR